MHNINMHINMFHTCLSKGMNLGKVKLAVLPQIYVWKWNSLVDPCLFSYWLILPECLFFHSRDGSWVPDACSTGGIRFYPSSETVT